MTIKLDQTSPSINSSLNRHASEPEAKPLLLLLLLPSHAPVPGPFCPEDTVLSFIWVPTGRNTLPQYLLQSPEGPS